MADPVITDHYRAQLVLHGKSGFPHDKYVNTFVFRNDAQDGDGNVENSRNSMADRVAEALRVAYVETHLPGTAQSVSYYLPDVVIEDTATVKVYDLGQAAPRQPYERDILINPSGSMAYPTEVAACLSFYAGRNLPRQRGRVYIGPLATLAGHSTGVISPAVSPGCVAALLGMANSLMNPAVGALIKWVMLSQVDGVTREITRAWVDNGFDTQRRRGRMADQRTYFPADIG